MFVCTMYGDNDDDACYQFVWRYPWRFDKGAEFTDGGVCESLWHCCGGDGFHGSQSEDKL